MVRLAMNDSVNTRKMVTTRLGRSLLIREPTTAPAMTGGSMIMMSDQSISGLSWCGCRREAARATLEMALPKMVTLESATATLGSKPATMIYRGTSTPPPPIPPACGWGGGRGGVRISG